ncbi:BatA domain-containing protein [Luteimonas yindakuii]|nr:BatA domain-containing protein [Luteimonas yindakuii]
MPTLLLPAGLLALAALLLPVLVHLARRQTLVPTPFAALRWLRAKARPRRQVRLDEWPLLLLRLLLLTLFALWLAQPALQGEPSMQRWSVVAPGVDPAALPPPAEGEQRRWLLPGWPTLDAPSSDADAAVPVGSLLRQLDMELDASVALTVYVPDPLDGADAQRPRLSRGVDWQVLPAAPRDADAVEPPLRLAIRHDAEHADGVRYLRAAAIAWSPEGAVEAADVGGIDVPVPPATQVLAWLVAGEVPQAVRDFAAQGGTVLLATDATWADAAPPVPVWRDADGGLLARASRHGRGRLIHFARPLRTTAWPQLLDPGFAGELQRQLQLPAAPTRAPASDYAPVQAELRWPASLRELRGPLLWLILLVLLAERWLATSRRRGATP